MRPTSEAVCTLNTCGIVYRLEMPSPPRVGQFPSASSWIIFSAYYPAAGRGGEFPWMGNEAPWFNHFLLFPERHCVCTGGAWVLSLAFWVPSGSPSLPSELAAPHSQPVLPLGGRNSSDLLLSLRTSLPFNCRGDRDVNKLNPRGQGAAAEQSERSLVWSARQPSSFGSSVGCPDLGFLICEVDSVTLVSQGIVRLTWEHAYRSLT